ncbi:MAG: metal-sulfur cluster assembly factor [bacterium]|nr:metal-sulfur cluster assembly factor [bacterium]
MAVSPKSILDKLKEVIDPELGISIVDLGLIYGVTIHKSAADVLMTFTTPFCPLAAKIEQQVKEKLMKLPKIKKVHVSITFDPPWTIEKISEVGKLKLGLIN